MPGVVEVDPRSRRAVVTGHGHANARILVDLDDERATTARADAHGDRTVTLPEIPFGEHRVAAVQRYDGAANGSDGRDLLIGGAPLVETAHVRFDEQQVLVESSSRVRPGPGAPSPSPIRTVLR